MVDQSDKSEIQRLEKDIEVKKEGSYAIDLLADTVPLSKQKLKQAMEKGGIWLKKTKGGRRRLRRAKSILNKGDILELRYDARILSSIAPTPKLIADKKHYSVWFKPEFVLSQGSKFADHCAITRWVEKNHLPKRAVYLVHRLDRAASGLMLLAHDQKTAAKLSKIFSTRNIRKRYKVVVKGDFSMDLPHAITSNLDGKTAHTVVISSEAKNNQSELVVEIKTGRKHQIRRHLSELGYPVVGDKLYGDTDANESLMLTANQLQFNCPVTGGLVTFDLEHKDNQPSIDK